MAMVHEKLCHAEDLAHVKLDYLNRRKKPNYHYD